MISDQPGVGFFQSIVQEGIGSGETATPMFVGVTAKGEVQQSYLIESIQDFEAEFGGAFERPKEGLIRPALYYTVRHYFDNGGERCFIYSLAGYLALENITLNGFLEMLADPRIGEVIAGESRINIVAVPDLVMLDALAEENDVESWIVAWQRIVEWCESRRGVFGLLDAPVSAQRARSCADRFSERINVGRRAWVAAYWPRLISDYQRMTSRLSDLSARGTGKPVMALATSQTTPVQTRTPSQADISAISIADSSSTRQVLEIDQDSPWEEIPPSGAVAALIGTIDRDRGIWAAPANVQLAHVVKPALPYGDATNLFSDNGISVNLIRSFPGRGVKIWGCRTLADGTQSGWRYIQVRRLVAYIETSLAEVARFVVFEPNNEITWMKLKGQTVTWLRTLWMEGALAGVQENDAFRVLVGLDESMTSEDILSGMLIMQIDLAVLIPAEFIRIDLRFRTNDPYAWQTAALAGERAIS